jgi:phytanoyl-CoA hydroxylase
MTASRHAAALPATPAAPLETFRAAGYCVVDAVFTPAQCDALNAAVEEFLDRQPGDEKYKPLMNPDRENPVVAAAVRHPALVAAAEQLFGARIEAIQTQYFWKPPGALGHDPHQDNFYVRSDRDTFIAAWVALEDAGPDNGGLVVYPGSHAEDILPVEDVAVPASDRPLFPNQKGRSTVIPARYQPTPVQVARGSAIFMHGHLVHSSVDNRSRRFRRSFLVDYIREGAPFAVGRHANRTRINVYP